MNHSRRYLERNFCSNPYKNPRAKSWRNLASISRKTSKSRFRINLRKHFQMIPKRIFPRTPNRNFLNKSEKKNLMESQKGFPENIRLSQEEFLKSPRRTFRMNPKNNLSLENPSENSLGVSRKCFQI